MNRNERDFDQRLKHLLEHAPETRPDEAAIHNIVGRLEAGEAGFLWGFLTWQRALWLAIGAIPFLWGYFHFQGELQDARDKLEALRLQMASSVVLADTVYQQQVVYQTDTVYRVVYVQEQVAPSVPSVPAYHQLQASQDSHWPYVTSLPNDPKPGYPAITSAGGLSASSRFSRHFVPEGNAAPKLKAGPDDGKITPADQDSASAEPGFPTPEMLRPVNHRLTVDLARVKEYTGQKIPTERPAARRRLRAGNVVRAMEPEGYRIGGDLHPLSVLVNEGHTGIGAGATFSALMGDRLSLSLGLDATYFDFEEHDPQKLQHYPTGNPGNEEDQLREIHTQLMIVEMPVGVEWNLTRSDKWQPYAGLAWVPRIPVMQRFNYEFESEENEHYLTDVFAGPGPVIWNNARVMTGLRLNLNRDWSIHSDLRYTFGPDDLRQTILYMNRVRFNLGFAYQL